MSDNVLYRGIGWDRMNENNEGIWKKLLLALAATPMTAVIGSLCIMLVGAIDQGIIQVQLNGHWWVILIGSFGLSFIYFSYKPMVQKYYERKKVAYGLILYWEEQLIKQGKQQPSSRELEEVENMFIERLKVWAWYNPEMWARCFPNENYSTYLFGIVDNFMLY